MKELDRATVASLLRVCLAERGGPNDMNAESVTVEDVAGYIAPDEGSCIRCAGPKCTGARKIFATLALIARESDIVGILKAGACDSHLPFSINENRLIAPKDSIAKLSFADIDGIDGGRWELEEKRLFCQSQWAFLSPYFCQTDIAETQPITVPGAATLPWVEHKMRSNDSMSNNGHGDKRTVVKVKIHRDHHNLVRGLHENIGHLLLG